MSNGNELNQFLNAMPGWLIQLRQMKQRAQQVKSQQDIQREKLELDQQRTLSIIGEAKDVQIYRKLKHDLDLAKSINRITELAKVDGQHFRVTYNQDTGEEISRVPVTKEVFIKETEEYSSTSTKRPSFTMITNYDTYRDVLDEYNTVEDKETWMFTNNIKLTEITKFQKYINNFEKLYGKREQTQEQPQAQPINPELDNLFEGLP